MSRILSNVEVTHVSFVDKGANKKSFFLLKSEQELNLTKEIKLIAKEDETKQLAYGLVYEPDVEDAHGDSMTAEEIEKSAHYFMQHQHIDKQHNFDDSTDYGHVVESYIAPADLVIGGVDVVKGSWLMAVKASDSVWEEIQKGEVTGFSLAGMAEIEEVAKSVKDTFNRNALGRNVFTAFWALEEEMYNINNITLPDFITETEAFLSILHEIKNADDNGEVLLLMKQEFDGSEEITAEDVIKAFEKAMQKQG